MPTHHFIHIGSASCSVHGKFKFCFWEISGIVSFNICDVCLIESSDTQGQLHSKNVSYCFYTTIVFIQAIV